MIAYWTDWTEKYPIISIEDGLAEIDWEGWTKITQNIGKKVQLVGDDLFVTNTKFLQKGIDTGAANSILIKVNQIGTLTETLDTIELAKTNNMTCRYLASFGRNRRSASSPIWRSRPTPDRSRPVRLSRSDRIAKYNQLLRIEEDLDNSAKYLGRKAFYQIKG